jgi:hydrogenase-4 component E
LTSVAQFVGTLALLLAFALLYEQRLGVAMRICALQGVATALAAGIQVWPRAAASTVVVVVIAAALNGVAMPIALQSLLGRSDSRPTTRREHNIRTSIVAVVLVTAAVATAMRVWTEASAPILASGLSIWLLGLLLMTIGRYRSMPAIGLLSMQNGAVLAASVVPGLPSLMFFACAVPFVPGLVASVMWSRRTYLPLVTPQ